MEQMWFVITNRTLEWFLAFMNWCNMHSQHPLLGTFVITNWTLVWFLAIMNWCNVKSQVLFFWRFVITKITFEWFLALMKWWNMVRQVPLYRTFVITNCSKVFCQVPILCTFVILLFGELREKNESCLTINMCYN